ncbi:hypothetical protein BC829DRAFT_160477 [Chytridium lagenaria]|nr:hypothetical protein BC829DRAFT_160477 [Chytridium lagenaria]
MNELVNFFYIWKKTAGYQIAYAKFCLKNRPGKTFKSLETGAVMSCADVLINNGEDYVTDDEAEKDKSKDNQRRECTNCWVSLSNAWISRQEGANKDCFCKDCGDYWQRYGGPRYISEASRRANREKAQIQSGKPPKRKLDYDEERKGKKRGRKPGSKNKVPEPAEDIVLPCAVCAEIDDPSWNATITCRTCKLRVHPECYGDSYKHQDSPWFLCSKCQNEKDPNACIVYECIFCPVTDPSSQGTLKRTIGKNWAHAACAIWLPEVKFGDTLSMEPVECAKFIDVKRWDSVRHFLRSS